MTRLRFGLAIGGFVTAAIAVGLDNRRLGWGAIALLAASLIVRLLQQRRHTDHDDL